MTSTAEPPTLRGQMRLVADEFKQAYWLGWDMAKLGHDSMANPFKIPMLIFYWCGGFRDYHNPAMKHPKYPRPETNPKWAKDGF